MSKKSDKNDADEKWYQDLLQKGREHDLAFEEENLKKHRDELKKMEKSRFWRGDLRYKESDLNKKNKEIEDSDKAAKEARLAATRHKEYRE